MVATRPPQQYTPPTTTSNSAISLTPPEAEAVRRTATLGMPKLLQLRNLNLEWHHPPIGPLLLPICQLRLQLNTILGRRFWTPTGEWKRQHCTKSNRGIKSQIWRKLKPASKDSASSKRSTMSESTTCSHMRTAVEQSKTNSQKMAHSRNAPKRAATCFSPCMKTWKTLTNRNPMDDQVTRLHLACYAKRAQYPGVRLQRQELGHHAIEILHRHAR